MATGCAWNEHEQTTAARLWKQGLSAAEIAKVLPGRSRNAVIGFVHRAGLPTRATKVRALVARRPRVARPSKPRAEKPRTAKPPAPRNMHITRIKPIPTPEKKPNVFDDSPASRAAMALLGISYSAEQRRAMYWGQR